MNTCIDKAGSIIDAECRYDNGKFYMKTFRGCLPELFTIRFTAPADYTAGDVVVVKGKELPVRTPGMTAATSDCFKAGAVIHCDIDLERELAFFWQGGGTGGVPGVVPNRSYEEQFAGFYDVDGSKVYVKTVDMGELPPAGKVVYHNIANINNVINFIYMWKRITTERGFGVGSHSNDYWCNVFVYDDRVQFSTNFTRLYGMTGQVTIYYTCTDR